jgi:hypothetical protein
MNDDFKLNYWKGHYGLVQATYRELFRYLCSKPGFALATTIDEAEIPVTFSRTIPKALVYKGVAISICILKNVEGIEIYFPRATVKRYRVYGNYDWTKYTYKKDARINTFERHVQFRAKTNVSLEDLVAKVETVYQRYIKNLAGAAKRNKEVARKIKLAEESIGKDPKAGTIHSYYTGLPKKATRIAQ